MILRDGALYDPDLDRFFRDLPLNGVRSRHSLRAYGYDVLVWARFLLEACARTIWQADRHDVLAYHRVRRRTEVGQRISAASWNRAVACLDRLYRWGVQEGLIAEAPFTHRSVWRQGYGGRRSQMAARNDAYEPAARRADVSFVTLEDYRRFRDVGLKTLLPDGRTRLGARDRNGIRNALFADLLVTTGLRLEEASSLFTSDLVFADQRPGRQVWLDLPDAQAKGNRGRQILVPARLLEQVTDEANARIVASGRLSSADRIFQHLYCMRLRRGLPVSNLSEDLHARFHLRAMDIPPLLTFLSLETGLEIECCKALTINCLQNPRPGTIEIAYEKRRARGAEHKHICVRDGGIGTPGGLIRTLASVPSNVPSCALARICVNAVCGGNPSGAAHSFATIRHLWGRNFRERHN
nr:site-specific integrase [Acetobacter indonesiensis]